jgi:hypothetical protein
VPGPALLSLASRVRYDPSLSPLPSVMIDVDQRALIRAEPMPVPCLRTSNAVNHMNLFSYKIRLPLVFHYNKKLTNGLLVPKLRSPTAEGTTQPHHLPPLTPAPSSLSSSGLFIYFLCVSELPPWVRFCAGCGGCNS